MKVRVGASPEGAPAEEQVALGEARRIALAAQGFAEPRPAAPVDADQLARAIDRVALLQLDSINVFCRSHYLPLFSRLGPYPREALDAIAGHTEGEVDRRLVEYWAHQTSLIPVATLPLLRWRMARVDVEAYRQIVTFARENPDVVNRVRQLVRDQGPLRAADAGTAAPRPLAGARNNMMMNWNDGKMALEYLFYAGEVTAERRINFERVYDLTERVLPADAAVETPPEADAQRELVRIAARALGVATEPDLGDYFRLPRAASKARVAELVAAGELVPVAVEGWAAPAYLWPAAARPGEIGAAALLSPFDSLIWARERAQRLFGFDYRVEIYTPAEKRVYGYYVLPFLLGDSLVARVDLKSDRKEGALLVQSAHGEPGIDRPVVAAALASELGTVATWLGLAEVRVGAAGDLAQPLTRALS